MKAKEYLEANHPDLMAVIKVHVPIKVDLTVALNGFYEAKSKEEAEERFIKAVDSLTDHTTGLTVRTGPITNRALIIASGKEKE